jgi:predicted RNase H-like nuclease
MAERPVVIAIDIPIGLLDKAERGGRGCDRRARELLGWPRRNSVFSPPVRKALQQKTFTAALRVNRMSSRENIGLSKQCFALFEKIREVDEAMTPALQGRVKEVHPELCFYELNGGEAIMHSKKSNEGFNARKPLLERLGFSQPMEEMMSYARKNVARDDILDACVACWAAERIQQCSGIRIPEAPPKDGRHLIMEMSR